MQPIKITIQGDFVDCQIYRGRLYLWTFDGRIKVYKWVDLVNSLAKDEADAITLKFCFLDGNFLYKTELIELFKDKEFNSLLINKFLSVSTQNFEISANQADDFLFGEQDSPKNSLPTDTEIYNNKLYFITEKGLFVTSAHRNNNKYPVSTKPEHLWDCNLLSIKANKYPQLALSGGNEGLFELNISNDDDIWDKKNPIQICKGHSSFANYAYWSIYNSSNVDKSYMALFSLSQTESENEIADVFPSNKPYIREYQEIVNDDKIFGTENIGKYLSWGVQDKIYRATDFGFEIVKFNNKPKEYDGESYFEPIQTINLHPWKGKVIDGGTAYFGTVVECENALVVMLSNGESTTIEGPVTRWRVYPRSFNYENQLHVIKDDKIEIYSFNQDYFLNQKDKLVGIQYNEQNHIRSRRLVKYFRMYTSNLKP
jgi:hypothetical protein